VWGFIIVGVLSVIVMFFFMPTGRPRAAEGEGMNDEETASSYDRVSRWPLFHWIRRKVMKKLRKRNLDGILMDLGCGPGHLAEMIGRKYPGLSVTGVDISRTMIETAWRKRDESEHANVRFLVGDVHQLPFDDAEVDFVLSTLSLHHWRDASSALGEIRRVLKPGGQFLLMDLRRNAPFVFYVLLLIGEKFFAPRALRRQNGALSSFKASYTPRELARLIGQVNFSQFSIRKEFGWMYAWGKK
jgi:ubiquinone/menaquinone biosynthesis C-methylase UbiE